MLIETFVALLLSNLAYYEHLEQLLGTEKIVILKEAVEQKKYDKVQEIMEEIEDITQGVATFSMA